MLIRNSVKRDSVCTGFKLAIIIMLLVAFVSESEIYAQKTRNETPPLRERLFYGGSFGLQFGTITDIDISPVVGLWLLPRLNVAAGPKYRFFKYYDYRADIYGGRVYSQFVFIKDLDNIIPAGIHFGFFLHAEDEFFSLNETIDTESGSFFINTPLVGAGISEPLGRRSSFNLMFLWALTDPFDIYGDPEIRISFMF
jgi:hypothetical protein